MGTKAKVKAGCIMGALYGAHLGERQLLESLGESKERRWVRDAIKGYKESLEDLRKLEEMSGVETLALKCVATNDYFNVLCKAVEKRSNMQGNPKRGKTSFNNRRL